MTRVEACLANLPIFRTAIPLSFDSPSPSHSQYLSILAKFHRFFSLIQIPPDFSHLNRLLKPFCGPPTRKRQLFPLALPKNGSFLLSLCCVSPKHSLRFPFAYQLSFIIEDQLLCEQRKQKPPGQPQIRTALQPPYETGQFNWNKDVWRQSRNQFRYFPGPADVVLSGLRLNPQSVEDVADVDVLEVDPADDAINLVKLLLLALKLQIEAVSGLRTAEKISHLLETDVSPQLAESLVEQIIKFLFSDDVISSGKKFAQFGLEKGFAGDLFDHVVVDVRVDVATVFLAQPQIGTVLRRFNRTRY